MLLLLLYSPVAGAVARLALLVTVSPSTLSSFTWFLFISFSSFFLLSVRSLLTWGAPLLVTCCPPRGPGGPWSDSILGHMEAWPVAAAEMFSSLRGEKVLRGSECCHFKVTDRLLLWSLMAVTSPTYLCFTWCTLHKAKEEQRLYGRQSL